MRNSYNSYGPSHCADQDYESGQITVKQQRSEHVQLRRLDRLLGAAPQQGHQWIPGASTARRDNEVS